MTRKGDYSREQIIAQLIAAGRDLVPDDPAERDTSRRMANFNNVLVYLTAEQEAEKDAEIAAVEADRTDYFANRKYKDDRVRGTFADGDELVDGEKLTEGYLSIGDQLDMLYWDKINGTDKWAEHVAEVKAVHPKPVG